LLGKPDQAQTNSSSKWNSLLKQVGRLVHLNYLEIDDDTAEVLLKPEDLDPLKACKELTHLGLAAACDKYMLVNGELDEYLDCWTRLKHLILVSHLELYEVGLVFAPSTNELIKRRGIIDRCFGHSSDEDWDED
jgi:hypothetical protein